MDWLWTRLVAFSAGVFFQGCSSDGRQAFPGDHRDASVSDASALEDEFGNDEDGSRSLESPGADCRTGEPITSLRVIGEPAVVFAVDDHCGDIPSQRVLLVNDSEASVTLEKVNMVNAALESDSAPGTFELRSHVAALPYTLGPDESIPVDLLFNAEAPLMTATGELQVVTSHGCQSFQVFGIRPQDDGSLLVLNPPAVDFGTIRPGETGEPVDITFTFIAMPGTPAPGNESIFSVGAGKDESFEVVEAIEPTVSRDCNQQTATVRMVASNSLGTRTGTLLFEISDGEATAIGAVELRGRVSNE